MKLVTFNSRAGAVVGGGVVDLTGRMRVRSIRQLLEEGRLAEAAALTPADFALDEVKLDLPVPDPAKIFCVGVNYVDRNAEYKDASEAPKYPSLFMRTPLSFVPQGEAQVIPRE